VKNLYILALQELGETLAEYWDYCVETRDTVSTWAEKQGLDVLCVEMDGCFHPWGWGFHAAIFHDGLIHDLYCPPLSPEEYRRWMFSDPDAVRICYRDGDDYINLETGEVYE